MIIYYIYYIYICEISYLISCPRVPGSQTQRLCSLGAPPPPRVIPRRASAGHRLDAGPRVLHGSRWCPSYLAKLVYKSHN